MEQLELFWESKNKKYFVYWYDIYDEEVQ